ncbi:unnamed protein product [Closterium sp. NIES-54]
MRPLWTAQALYAVVVAHYSSPATATLGCLLLPYLFPELSAFATVEDLPPIFITLYFIVTRLPNSLRSVKDHFLSLHPTSLTVDLLEQHLLAAETSAVAVGAATGTPRPPFFEGCSPSPLAPSYASTAAAVVCVAEDVGAASAMGKGGRGGGGGSGGGGGGSRSGGGGSSGGGGGNGGGGSGGSGGGGGGVGGGGGGSSRSGGSGGCGTGARHGGFGGGQRQQQQLRSETRSPQQLREWLFQCGTSGGSDSCPYVIRTGVRAGQTCLKLHTQYRCFSRLDDAWRAEFGDDVKLPRWADLLGSRIAIFDLDFDAILFAMYALSVSAEGDYYSESGTLPGTTPSQALHTFTLDSGASRCFFRESTTLTPLHVRLADPSGGPVVARSSTVLPCLVVLSGSLSGLHLPSFSTNLVSTAALQDAMVTTTTPGGKRVSICTCTRTGRHLATFTLRPRSSLYTLTTEPSQVAASAQVSTSGQVAASCSCRLLSHQTLLWHHRLDHPSLPRLRGMHSHLLVSRLPRSLPPLPPSPAPPCHPCIEGRQRAAPHSSSFPTTTAPLQTLHMDDLPILRLHFDRGGEFSSDLLRDFCHGESILQSFTLPDSHQQNGIAECRIGLVMEVAHTSMIHAAAPHLQWPFASEGLGFESLCVHFGHPSAGGCQRSNGDPRLILGKGYRLVVLGGYGRTDPLLNKPFYPNGLVVGILTVGNASVFRVWGSRAFVRDTSADKLSTRAIPCDVTFDESVPFYRLLPYRSAPPPPPPLFLAHGPLPVDPLLPQGPAPSGAALGAASGGAAFGGAKTGVAGSEGAKSGGAEPGGEKTRGAEPEGVEPGGVESEGSESGGAEPRVIAAAGPGGARTTGVGAAGTGGVGGTGAGDPTEPGAARAGGSCAGEAGAGGAGAGGARVGGTGAGGAGAAGAGAVDPGAGGAGGTVRPRLYFVPLLQQPASPLRAPSPYTEQSGGLTERREPASRPVSPVRTTRRIPRSRPRPLLGTHAMALRPSSVPLRVPLPAPPESSLPEVPDPESDRARAASPIVSHLLANAVTNPSFDSAAACALVAELLDFAAACRLDYATALVAESKSSSPPFIAGECALGTDVLEDRQEDFKCLAAAVPGFVSMLLALEGDPDAPNIPTPRSYAEAITGTQWGFQRPVYGLRQVPREWHDTLRTTLPALGNLGLQITWDRARRTITLTESHMVHKVLHRFGFQFSSPQPTPLSTSHSLSAPPSDESVEPSDASWVDDSATQRSSQGYTFCLGSGSVSWRSTRSFSVLSFSCEAEIYAGAMAAQELCWLTYLLTYLGEQPRSPPVLYVDNKAMIALCQEHRREHRTKHIALRYFLARELQQRGQLRLAYVATRANSADIFTKALLPGDHQRFSTVLGLVPTLPHLLTA